MDKNAGQAAEAADATRTQPDAGRRLRPGLPHNEVQRVARLRELGLLDTAAEELLDGFTRLAAAVTGMPIALVSLVDSDRQWFKSAVGLAQGTETPRDHAFCAHAICQEGIFEVGDAREDPRFAANPLVRGAPNVVHYAGVPLTLPGGESIGTLCVIGQQPGSLPQLHRKLLLDIAQNIVHVLLLREREMRLQRERLLAEAAEFSELAPVGMFALDARGDVLHGNARWIRMLGGNSLQDCKGTSWCCAVHPEDASEVFILWNEGVGSAQPFVLTFRFRPEPGKREQWLRFHVKPAAPDLAPAAFVGVAVDVTETMSLQRESQRKSRLLAAVIEHLPIGVAVFDADRRHLVSNAAARDLFRLPPHLFEQPDLRYDDLARILAERGDFGPGDPEVLLARRLESILRREPQQHERQLSSGGVLEVRGSFMPDGGIIFTYRDVTAERDAQRKLQVALQAADQANQAKTDFLATMSHEIRTPLNGVIGLTQLLADADLPHAEADSVTMIDSCAKSLLSLVDNILDFSKIEAGRLTLEPAPCDVGQLVREVSDVFGVRASDKGLRFQLSQAPGLPQWILVDPGRLRQILLNLLGNALKFTSQGGFSLDVSVQPGAVGPMLRFAVADTGVGIAPQDLSKLFLRFSQVDASATRNFNGTGLGLAICRQLAQLMGGDVSLESQLGVGSTFTLLLPLHRASAPQAAPSRAGILENSAAAILLAEDNEVNLLVARRMLTSLGVHDVHVVENGQDAVRTCAQRAFDLILMDCQMPVMDGLEATRQLRRAGISTPIIAFTAGATAHDRERCLQAGMDDFITKPVERQVLSDKVLRWLRAGADRQALDDAPSGSGHGCDFDSRAINDYFLGEGEVFAQARDLFIRSARRDLQAPWLADAEVDLEAVRRLAHCLRGTAATLGASRLEGLCARLEQARQPSRPELRRTIQAVRSAFEAFVVASEPVAVHS